MVAAYGSLGPMSICYDYTNTLTGWRDRLNALVPYASLVGYSTLSA